MSRGPGRWQRAILDAVADHPDQPVQLTFPEMSYSTQVAILRAARTLEAAGKVQTASVRVDSVNRLVVLAPDVEAPPTRKVTGLDGKVYKLPGTMKPRG